MKENLQSDMVCWRLRATLLWEADCPADCVFLVVSEPFKDSFVALLGTTLESPVALKTDIKDGFW